MNRAERMKRKVRYISVFSGIEAATVAWEPLGWEPVAFCEIDAFPSAVLAHRFTNVPNLGDVTKVDWRNYRGEIDIVVGGSPCQSFSIAGNRTGLEGASGLMWEYVRCVREVRPIWFVWENVPGALSSSKGEDFRCLLEIMDELGYGLAWRVLDAQFFGVPQRRRRLFLVGSLGDRRAADVLFEPECLRRDSTSSRDKRKSLAGRVKGRSGIRSKTMLVRCGCEGGGKGALIQDDMSATLSTSNEQTIFQPICMDAGNNHCAGFKYHQGSKAGNIGYGDEISPTITADWHVPAVMYADEVVRGCASCAITSKYIVRRLTPVECERLQGFPDGWTDIEWKGKKAPDGKRYKALGNSMAVPVMRWIGERIDAVYSGAKVVEE